MAHLSGQKSLKTETGVSEKHNNYNNSSSIMGCEDQGISSTNFNERSSNSHNLLGNQRSFDSDSSHSVLTTSKTLQKQQSNLSLPPNMNQNLDSDNLHNIVGGKMLDGRRKYSQNVIL